MTEIYGIDVSRWNGVINWKAVADYGKVNFAILRITEKCDVTDPTFEPNYKGCVENNIPVGVYKYSYATSVAQIKEEANTIIKVLKGRKLDYPVFLDIEDKCQERLPKETMESFIEAFREIIEKSHYKFAIYTGYYWYQTKLPEFAKKYDCWLAAYPANDDGTLQERLRPPVGIGWQYSSKAKIPGINGVVDRNVFYKDYSKTQTENKPDTGDKNMGYTKQDAINAVLNVARDEIGYLEKATDSQLDSKTANAGKSNFTKYWRDIKPAWNGSAWCACFITWIFVQVFGREVTEKLLKHYPYVYCPTLGNLFTKYANPETGDIVIFWRNGTFAHTGIVTKVQGDKFWTIEGNTSSGSEIIPNGGAVCEKSYYNSNLPGTKFCRIDWDYAAKHLKTIATPTPPPTQPTTPSTNKTYNKTSKWKGIVTASSLNVRKLPTIEADTCSFSPLKKNIIVDVCDDNSDSGDKWYYIKYNDKYGFVSAKYIEKQDISKPTAPSDEWVGEVTASELNVRTAPGTGSPIQKSYPKLAKGNKIRVLSAAKATDGSKWYKIVINNKLTQNKDVIGFVSATYIKKA